jgi:ribonuclease BN (tRNA processing enzyme)
MQVRILGAHQCQTADRHFTSILVDDWLAIDAGSLATALTLDEQLRVTDLLITHQHWDHVKDIGGFGYNLLSARPDGHSDVGARVHCTREVRDAIVAHLLAEHFWMNFFALPSPDQPIFSFRETGPGVELAVGPYRVRSVPVPHGVPVQGYQVAAPDGGSVFYTGDNGEGAARAWATVRPDVLITECTYSDAFVRREGGKLYGHLTPTLLQGELEDFRALRGYLPRVVVVHVNPFSEGEIRTELAVVAQDLGVSIEVAREGLRFSV